MRKPYELLGGGRAGGGGALVEPAQKECASHCGFLGKNLTLSVIVLRELNRVKTNVETELSFNHPNTTRIPRKPPCIDDTHAI